MTTLERALQTKINVKSYAALRERVRETLFVGQQKIETEKVLTYWKAGTQIAVFIDRHPKETGYGDRVVQRLAQDLGVSSRILFDILRFARTYPKLPARALFGRNPNGQRVLTWTDYRRLISVEDGAKRRLLEDKILRGGWSTRKIEANVRQNQDAKTEKEAKSYAPLKALVGKLDTYQVVDSSTVGTPSESAAKTLFFDHGFRMYRRLNTDEGKNIKAGDIVEFASVNGSRLGGRDDKTYVLIKSDREEKDRFFYQAASAKVLDGDTFWSAIDAGFSEIARQKLRLRGIDAPELSEPGGIRAFHFLRAFLPEGTSILLHTSHSLSHDRFVADVFVPVSEHAKKVIKKYASSKNQPKIPIKDCIPSIAPHGEFYFLNNLMLALGLAVRAEE